MNRASDMLADPVVTRLMPKAMLKPVVAGNGVDAKQAAVVETVSRTDASNVKRLLSYHNPHD